MKLSEKQLRNLVLSEVKRINEEALPPDPAAIKHVVVNAEKLLRAINSFMSGASDEMKAALGNLEGCKKTLENMLNAPVSYIPKQLPVVKKVSFKAVKED